MRKTILNTILGIIVMVIYFRLYASISGDPGADPEIRTESLEISVPQEDLFYEAGQKEKADYQLDRNVFIPSPIRKLEKTRKRVVGIQPEIRVDTLAIVGDKHKVSYLLKQGECIWITASGQ